MKILMKCAYCRRKKIFDVRVVDKQKGIVFCSRKCRNRFTWLVENYGSPIWEISFKKKFKRDPLPKDYKVVKKMENFLLESFEYHIKREQINYLLKYGRMPDDFI